MAKGTPHFTLVVTILHMFNVFIPFRRSFAHEVNMHVHNNLVKSDEVLPK